MEPYKQPETQALSRSSCTLYTVCCLKCYQATSETWQRAGVEDSWASRGQLGWRYSWTLPRSWSHVASFPITTRLRLFGGTRAQPSPWRRLRTSSPHTSPTGISYCYCAPHANKGAVPEVPCKESADDISCAFNYAKQIDRYSDINVNWRPKQAEACYPGDDSIHQRNTLRVLLLSACFPGEALVDYLFIKGITVHHF